MEKIWNWFNGKKSVIGAYTFGAAYVIGKMASIWGIQYSWIPQVIDTLNESGAILTGAGFIHKGIKAVKP